MLPACSVCQRAVAAGYHAEGCEIKRGALQSQLVDCGKCAVVATVAVEVAVGKSSRVGVVQLTVV